VKKAPMIADLLGQRPLFYRSVAIERDVADPSAGRSFVMTPWLERGAREIVAGLAAPSTRKAWRIIGDFGVGKSALALALVQALDPRLANPSMPMRNLAAEANAPRMFPVLVTGSRDGLAAELTASIRRAAAANRVSSCRRAPIRVRRGLRHEMRPPSLSASTRSARRVRAFSAR